MLCFLFLISTLATQPGEFDTLSNFYTELAGNEWVKNTNWLNEKVDVCDWYGITCDKDGYVYQITLSSNNLVGVLPKLSGLTKLYALVIDNNQVSGSLTALNGLSLFEAISIKNNKFSGYANAEGTILRFFHADNNQFDDILYLVKNCPLLEVIGLTGNKVMTIPRSINTLIHLRTLSLGSNSITSEIPPLTNLVKLATIDLSNNQIVGAIPESLGSLPSIVEILLGHNKISGKLPSSLFSGKSLVLIDLSNNDITGDLSPMNYSPVVTSVYLKNTQVSGKLPELIVSSVQLLDVRGTQVSCPVPYMYRERVLADCPALVTVTSHGMSKCPDFENLVNGALYPMLEQIGDIIDFKFGWIITENTEYPTGYYSMHGNTEVQGDFMFSCVNALYNSSKAMSFYQCLSSSLDSVPLDFTLCAEHQRLDPIAITKCTNDAYGKQLIKDGMDDVKRLGSTWSPTVYINDKLYCLYDSSPCGAATIEDWIRDVCKEYKGDKKPEACGNN
ncbi:polygalacturonase inhibitor 1 precursor, putative [Entamoeba invadens IP1]|uniref:polygalacturonase inhibitor 1 precursor, putative n=1 Tax=Entamoeba invadens IP1 TaxID=370355 RepID=UPI0002C3D255|nr:polygalacturonase inhibitor 1 precursor, putative [Entamoeba invadens IP1]ELP93455.1 polygalacturonase inhibitor 1 precursor, putative [Entamoeba invadens IP1]|eukprot:XP_004260226.1 polygalacturonase inhibitor 1 precursor, putative [Entamoeba invadens IP1]